MIGAQLRMCGTHHIRPLVSSQRTRTPDLFSYTNNQTMWVTTHKHPIVDINISAWRELLVLCPKHRDLDLSVENKVPLLWREKTTTIRDYLNCRGKDKHQTHGRRFFFFFFLHILKLFSHSHANTHTVTHGKLSQPFPDISNVVLRKLGMIVYMTEIQVIFKAILVKQWPGVMSSVLRSLS